MQLSKEYLNEIQAEWNNFNEKVKEEFPDCEQKCRTNIEMNKYQNLLKGKVATNP